MEAESKMKKKKKKTICSFGSRFLCFKVMSLKPNTTINNRKHRLKKISKHVKLPFKLGEKMVGERSGAYRRDYITKMWKIWLKRFLNAPNKRWQYFGVFKCK